MHNIWIPRLDYSGLPKLKNSILSSEALLSKDIRECECFSYAAYKPIFCICCWQQMVLFYQLLRLSTKRVILSLLLANKQVFVEQLNLCKHSLIARVFLSKGDAS